MAHVETLLLLYFKGFKYLRIYKLFLKHLLVHQASVIRKQICAFKQAYSVKEKITDF